MSTLAKCLILLAVLLCILMPFIVTYIQARADSRRYRRQAETARITRERIDEIEARDR